MEGGCCGERPVHRQHPLIAADGELFTIPRYLLATFR
jgi:hypothetical protein